MNYNCQNSEIFLSVSDFGFFLGGGLKEHMKCLLKTFNQHKSSAVCKRSKFNINSTSVVIYPLVNVIKECNLISYGWPTWFSTC